MLRKAFDQFSFDLVICLDQLAGFRMAQAIKSGTAVIYLAEQAFGLIQLRAQCIRYVRRSHELLSCSFCTQPPKASDRQAFSSMLVRRLFRQVRVNMSQWQLSKPSLNSQPIRVYYPATHTHTHRWINILSAWKKLGYAAGQIGSKLLFYH